MAVPFLDSHVHLFPEKVSSYGLEKFRKEASVVDDVLGLIYIECSTAYYEHGPVEERPLGEIQWVAQVAKNLNKHSDIPDILGIVSYLDLTLSHGDIQRLIGKHRELGDGLFRGIRHRAAYSEDRMLDGNDLLKSRKDLYLDKKFQAGVDQLGENEVTFEAWNYHTQTDQLLECLAACPNTQFILNHFCSPIGVGKFAGKQDEIFPQWAKAIENIAKFDNIVAKLGGMAMPLNGWGWDKRDEKASCEEILEAQQKYYHHTIECFGTSRCLFESNFPVDRLSTSYPEVVKMMRQIAAEYPIECQHKLLHENSKKIYKV